VIYDIHVHPIFYDQICEDEKECLFRGDTFGVWKQAPMSYSEIFAEMDYGGITMANLLPLDLSVSCGGQIVTNQQIADIVASHHDRFSGFASVDPWDEAAVEKLDFAFSKLGLSGLKLNPSKQRFYPSDKPIDPIYKKCIEYNKPILFHAGMSWEPNAPADYSQPLRFEEVFIKYPELRCCLAHFGWPWVRETVMLLLKYPNVYTDTSLLYLDSPEESMTRLFSVDMGRLWFERSFMKQVMFGSNGPRFRAFKIKRGLEAVNFSAEAQDALYWSNAQRFLNGGDS
jgi:uncharacterized protein